MAGVVKIDNRLPKDISRVFDYLNERKVKATWSEIYGPMSDLSGEIYIWRGYGKEIAQELDINLRATYNSITVLESLGCLRKIKHGAQNTPSIYRIVKEPDVTEYYRLKEQSSMFGKPIAMSKADRLQDSLNKALHRISVLESAVARIERRLDVNRGRHHA